MFFLQLVLYFIISISQISFGAKFLDSNFGEVRKFCAILPLTIDRQHDNEDYYDSKDINKSVTDKRTFCLRSDGVYLENGVVEVDVYTRSMSNDDYITIALQDAYLDGSNAILKGTTVFGYYCLENGVEKIYVDIIGMSKEVLVLIKGKVSKKSQVIVDSIRFTNSSKTLMIYKLKKDYISNEDDEGHEYYDDNAQSMTTGEDESKTVAIKSESMSLKTGTEPTENTPANIESTENEYSSKIFKMSTIENTLLSSTAEASTGPKSTQTSTVVMLKSKIFFGTSRTAKLAAEPDTESQDSIKTVDSTASDPKTVEDQGFWTPLTISLVTIASAASAAIIGFSVYKLVVNRKSSISLEIGDSEQ